MKKIKGLKQLRERRDETIKKWEATGILDGLKPMKDGNLAELFQGETSYKITEDDILPHARQVVNKMNELEQAELIRKSNQELIEKLEDFKLHPENYSEPKYRTRSDSHGEIAVIQENEYVVTGVIVRSKSKAEIGLINTFHKSELVPFIRLKCNHPSHKK